MDGEAPRVGADLQGADQIQKKDIDLPRVFGLERRLWDPGDEAKRTNKSVMGRESLCVDKQDKRTDYTKLGYGKMS